MKPITVLLAEDQELIRENFRSSLDHESDMKVVGEAENGRQAMQLTRKLRPAVLVMDVAMPLLNGLTSTREILEAVPGTRILLLADLYEGAYVKNAIACGAVGFLLKPASAHVLSEGIREVNRGHVFFGPSIPNCFLENERKSLDRSGRLGPRSGRLTVREMQVLQLIAEGLPNKQIAAELGLSFKTVDKHRQRLMRKLNIHDVAGITRYAIAEGFIQIKAQGAVIARAAIGRGMTVRKQEGEDRLQFIGERATDPAEIKTPHGLQPVCSTCGKILDEDGCRQLIEPYIAGQVQEFENGAIRHARSAV